MGLLMDEADLGNESAAFHLRLNLAGATARPAGPGSGVCIDCGETIPEARRLAVPGCIRCRECQAEAET
ncbi:MAG: TraR/DksA C4-type zinc finger protein [Thermodesulfobacteriota bacterium]